MPVHVVERRCVLELKFDCVDTEEDGEFVI